MGDSKDQLKMTQPKSKIIEKLKLGFQQMLQSKDPHKYRIRELSAADPAINLSCEVTNIKSVGSTQSRASRKTKPNMLIASNNLQLVKKNTKPEVTHRQKQSNSIKVSKQTFVAQKQLAINNDGFSIFDSNLVPNEVSGRLVHQSLMKS